MKKIMRLKEAMSHVMTLRHPVFADRMMSKHYIAKICEVQPIMIDKWMSGDTRTIRTSAVEKFYKEFDILIDDQDIGGQLEMKVLHDKLVI